MQGVHVIGDVMSDANRLAREVVDSDPGRFLECLPAELAESGYGLLTLHRAENTDDRARLLEIVDGLNQVELPLIFPIHPRTRLAFDRERVELNPNIHTCHPVGYLEMIALLSRAKVVLTDSGGLQKEAYWARVPCITLRGETEWTETVEEGWNRLTDGRGVHAAVSSLVIPDGQPLSYGSGACAERIPGLLVRRR